ncbi:glycosyltransferase family 4 protein [Saliterribacillus persicus]|uniref:Glycosyltransferase involved in cell wall biosynthesis n=1 Tax=Saliterribacillus persicus TaxID=930114 RepID=A0A368X9Q2_9BACI|nr:glycosyltransferase family 1 protein [Saliterribacillus persicus]RCW63728.1 glycosyltransferase involved in cell wall biosynthesis [Saliterribacillus persicus]
MKVAIITETFLPSTDGVVTRLLHAIDYLLSKDHEVLIIAPDLGVDRYKSANVEGIKARKLLFYRYKEFALPTKKVLTVLQDYQPDIVHVVNPAILGISGIYYTKKLKIPLLASYHTHVPKYFDYYRLSFLKPLCWQYFKMLHNPASLNLCTSQTVENELKEKKFYNVHLWNKGVDTERFHPKYHKNEMRNYLTNGESDKKLLLFVGRLAAEKEIETLLPVLNEKTDIRVAMIGDGPEREKLEKLFQPYPVKFTGFLHGEELANAYASADAFIFPSVTETLGLVILEAMAAGLPVIAAKSGPTIEQINDNINGLLYDQKNTADFIAKINLIEDENFHQTLKQNARIEAEKYSWKEASKQLEDFYYTVIEKN